MELDVPAKERPQARVVGKGKQAFVQFYTPAKTKAWEEHVGQVALEQLRSVEVDGPDDFTMPIRDSRIIVAMRFNRRRPKSLHKSVEHAVKKPDIDNLVKAILDGIVTAGVIEDDNAITDLTVSKRYASDEHPMGVEVDLTCLPL